jgi:hypothetical protein
VADEDAEKRARKEGERLAKELDVLVAKQDAAQVREVKERAARMKAKLAEERKLAKQVKSDMPTSDKISAQLASPGDSFGKSAGRTTPQMPPPRQRAED